VFVLGLVLGAIVLCISYVTKNITLIHKRELEILNQVGARDSFIARQLMVIIARLSLIGAGAGFIIAAPVLLIIIGMTRRLRVGMFTQMAIPGGGWIALCALAVGIIVLCVITTRKTVMKILRE
jgi:cell division protein FtsX